MPTDSLIATIAARLDQAAMTVMQSSASVDEQHAVLADLAFAHTMLTFLAKGDPDRVAIVIEALALSARVAVPKTTAPRSTTTSPTVGWSVNEHPSEMSDVERRSFLTLVATMAGAPPIEALAGLPDAELVAVLQQVTDRYRKRLQTVPAATMFGGIVRHAAEIERRTREAREPLRSQLLGVFAEAVGLAGQVAYLDLGRHEDAARSFRAATDAARAAQDLDRLALTYDRIALRLQFAGRPADALAMLERAARECVREPLSLTLCTLHKEMSVNLALLGEEHRALAGCFAHEGW